MTAVHVVALSAPAEDELRRSAGATATVAANGALSAPVHRTRPPGPARLFARGTAAELASKLSSFARGEPCDVKWRASASGAASIAFLFTGQSDNHPGMARRLYETHATFRRALDRSSALIEPYLGQSLSAAMFEAGADRVDRPNCAQPALFALQWALAEVWRGWGVRPGAVCGHSFGEYAAAAVAGAVRPDDGMALVVERARLVEQLPPGGCMAVAFGSEADVVDALGPQAGPVAVAAVNAPDVTVVSGESQAVERLCARLSERRIRSRQLRVSHAFHSPLMEPILDRFEATARAVPHARPGVPFASTVEGRLLGDGEALDARYWRRQLRGKVRFHEALSVLRSAGHRVFLELGPHRSLVQLGARAFRSGSDVWLSSLERERDDWDVLLDSAGALWLAGVDVDWRAIGFDLARRAPRHEQLAVG